MKKYDMSADLDYYIENQASLVEKYGGKYLLIVDQKVVGAYTSQDEAFKAAQKKKLAAGNFSIQLAEEGQDSYSTVLSRV